MLVEPFKEGDKSPMFEECKCGDDLKLPAGEKPRFKHETDGKERKKETKASK
jgi:hypothetical protein